MRRWVLFAAMAGIIPLGWNSLSAAGLVARAANVDAARVYPNPWRADRHTNIRVTFENLPAQSTVRLFTLSGHQVRTLSADTTGKALWDRTNAHGDVVASGVYLYLVADADGHETLGKLAIIR